mgnify:CR=1 FL=1
MGGAKASFVAFVMASGFYLVQPNENAVVLTFGKYERTDEVPGLKYRWPWPIQTVDIVNVTQEQRIEVGFRGGRGNAGVQDVADESLMLTGDENIVDLDFTVRWKIADPAAYLFNVLDPETTVAIVAESVMREIVGRTQIQRILTAEASDSARVQALWKVVYSRAASPDEMADALAHVHAVSQMRGEASFAWQNLAQALLASNEFMHVE